jgi:DNA mismatch endonuclease (patch repair protein)
MSDIVSQQKRSEMMAGIRSRNTKPEMRVRQVLFAGGYRFRLHRKDLPGTPDVVLPGRRVAIFVNGCFWHSHSECSLAKLPATRAEFWREKLLRNRERDEAAVGALRSQGWRVLVVWECFCRSCQKDGAMLEALKCWIDSPSAFGEMRAKVESIQTSSNSGKVKNQKTELK